MASLAFAPNTRNLSMSPDRRLLGKIAGHLYLARKILLEGEVSSMNEVRHEIRTMMLGHMPAGANSNNDEGSSEESSMLQGWLKKVVRMLREVPDVEDAVQGLPDELKRELARLIKQGNNLCSGSDEARNEIKQAMALYRQLSGASYL